MSANTVGQAGSLDSHAGTMRCAAVLIPIIGERGDALAWRRKRWRRRPADTACFEMIDYPGPSLGTGGCPRPTQWTLRQRSFAAAQGPPVTMWWRHLGHARHVAAQVRQGSDLGQGLGMRVLLGQPARGLPDSGSQPTRPPRGSTLPCDRRSPADRRRQVGARRRCPSP